MVLFLICFQSVMPFIHPPIHVSVHPSTHSCIHPSTFSSIHPSIHEATRPAMHPSSYPSIQPPVNSKDANLLLMNPPQFSPYIRVYTFPSIHLPYTLVRPIYLTHATIKLPAMHQPLGLPKENHGSSSLFFLYHGCQNRLLMKKRLMELSSKACMA